MDRPYRIVFSGRKTMALVVKPDESVEIRAPRRVSEKAALAFAASKEDWIARQIEKIRKRKENLPVIREEDRTYLTEKARKILPEKISRYSQILRLVPSGVRITGAKTRFGSCSSKNSLSFSYRLMAYSDFAIDYVVVHELCHIRYKNHGKLFYRLVSSVLPDYREAEKELKGEKSSPVSGEL